MSEDIYDNDYLQESVVKPDTRVADAAKKRSALWDLLQSEGWDIIIRILQVRLDKYEKQVFVPTLGIDDMIAKQHMIGAATELRYVIGLPQEIRKTTQAMLDMSSPSEEGE